MEMRESFSYELLDIILSTSRLSNRHKRPIRLYKLGTRKMAWVPTSYLQSLFSWPSRKFATRQLLLGILIGFSLSLTTTEYIRRTQRRKRKEQLEHFTRRPIELRSNEIVDGVAGLIGGQWIYVLTLEKPKLY